MDRFWKCIFDKRSIYYQFKKYYIILFSFSLLRELWNTLLLERSLTHKCRQVFKEGKKIGGVNCSQMIWENVEKLIAKNVVEDSGRFKALISQLFSNCSVYLGRCVYFNKTHINQALKTPAVLFEQKEVLFHLPIQQLPTTNAWFWKLAISILLVSHPF